MASTDDFVLTYPERENSSLISEKLIDSSLICCNVEYLVTTFKNYCPELYVKYSGELGTDYFITDTQKNFCPPKTQIRNSDSISVTIYTERTLDSATGEYIYDDDNGITYKFNGEVGQFPKLFTRDMYDETATQYLSRQLVSIKDIGFYYYKHKITVVLHDFAFTTGIRPQATNTTLDETNDVKTTADTVTYTLYMYQQTTTTIVIPAYGYIENYEQYKQSDFYVYFTGNDVLYPHFWFQTTYTNPTTLAAIYTIENISDDFQIDVYATYKDRINIYITTDGTVRVYDNAESSELSDNNIIIDYPGTYGSYTTAYNSINAFSFAIEPNDSDLYESYNYEFRAWERNSEPDDDGYTYSQTLKDSYSETDVDFSTRINSEKFLTSGVSTYFPDGLVYDENLTYTLEITTNAIYQGKNINIVMSGNYGSYMTVSAIDDANPDGVTLTGTTGLNRTNYIYTTYMDDQPGLKLRVTMTNTTFTGAELVNNIKLQDSQGNDTATTTFNNSTSTSATLTWSKTLKSNVTIYIVIGVIKLIDITVTKDSNDVSVYETFNLNDRTYSDELSFTNNTAIYTTKIASPRYISLYAYNNSTTMTQLTWKWYVNSILQDEDTKTVNTGYAGNFLKSNLSSSKSYLLQISLAELYNEKDIYVRLYNIDSQKVKDTGLSLENTRIQNSINGTSGWEDLSVSGPTDNTTGGYYEYTCHMTAGYYIKFTVNMETAYKYKTVTFTCTSDMANSSETVETVTLTDTHTSADITLAVPGPCSEFYVDVTFTETQTHAVYVNTQSDLSMLTFYNFDYGTSQYTKITFQGNKWNSTTSTRNPETFLLKILVPDTATYRSLMYYQYEYDKNGNPDKGELLETDEFTESEVDLGAGIYEHTVKEDWFNEHGTVVFEAVGVNINNHKIWIGIKTYVLETDGYKPTITESYGEYNDNVICDFSAGDYSTGTIDQWDMGCVSYDTIVGHLNEVKWTLSNPSGYNYNVYDIALYGTSSNITNVSDITTAEWEPLGEVTSQPYSTAFTWTWDTDLSGSSQSYTSYCFMLGSFKLDVVPEFISMGYDDDTQDNVIPSFARTDYSYNGERLAWFAYFKYYDASRALTVSDFYFNDRYKNSSGNTFMNELFSVTSVESTDEEYKYRVNLTTNHNLSWAMFYDETTETSANLRYFKEGVTMTDFLICEINGVKYSITGTVDRCLTIYFSENEKNTTVPGVIGYSVSFYYMEITKTYQSDDGSVISYPYDLEKENILISPSVSDFRLVTGYSSVTATEPMYYIYVDLAPNYVGNMIFDVHKRYYRANEEFTLLIADSTTHQVTVKLCLTNLDSEIDSLIINVTNSSSMDSTYDSTGHILHVNLNRIDDEIGVINNYSTLTTLGWVDYTDLTSASVTVRTFFSWISGSTGSLSSFAGPTFSIKNGCYYEMTIDINCSALKSGDTTTIINSIKCEGSATRYLNWTRTNSGEGPVGGDAPVVTLTTTTLASLVSLKEGTTGLMSIPISYTYSQTGSTVSTDEYVFPDIPIYNATGSEINYGDVPWDTSLYFLPWSLTDATGSGGVRTRRYGMWSTANIPVEKRDNMGKIPTKANFFTSSLLSDTAIGTILTS